MSSCHPLDGLVRLGSLYYCQSRQKDPMPNKLCLFFWVFCRLNSNLEWIVAAAVLLVAVMLVVQVAEASTSFLVCREFWESLVQIVCDRLVLLLLVHQLVCCRVEAFADFVLTICFLFVFFEPDISQKNGAVGASDGTKKRGKKERDPNISPSDYIVIVTQKSGDGIGIATHQTMRDY